MIRSSVSDFSRFVAACANEGSAHGVRILSAASMAEMLRVQKPSGLPTWLTGQALGWQESLLEGAETLNHAGGDTGVFTFVFIDRLTRRGVTVFTNVTATQQSKDAVKRIAGRLLGAQRQNPRV
jgi:hypothetical protein